jgi:electron transfer flavoprotein beta subunit
MVVCIKQVPDNAADVRITGETNTMVRENIPAVINPFDSYALEEGLRLKEKHGGSVAALSLGQPQAREAIREAIALGVDEGYLISDPASTDSDSLATAYALAMGIRKVGGVDLIILGKQATDGMTGQVGPQVAEELDIPHIALVRKIVGIGDGRLKVERLTDGGIEVVETSLPAVISVVKEINEPRLASLKGVMKAKKAEIPTWGLADIGADPERAGRVGSGTICSRAWKPEGRKKGEVITGSPDEAAAALVNRLRADKII